MVSRILHFPVTSGLGAAEIADPEQVKGLGDSPVTLRFNLDNEAVIEIAVPGESAEARGPFFSNTALVDDTGSVPSDSGRQAEQGDTAGRSSRQVFDLTSRDQK